MVMLTNGLDQAWNAVLLPVHARESLGGPAQLGLLVSLFGGFALLGALLYGVVGERFPRRALFAAAFLVCGPARWAVAAFTDTALPLAVTMALSGLGAGVLNPILTTAFYERVPDALRSRVAGVSTAGCELAMPVGGLAAGLLVQGYGLRAALLLLGGVYLLTVLGPLVFPAWRTMGPPKPAPGRGPDPLTDPAPDTAPHTAGDPDPAGHPDPVSSSGPSRPSPGPAASRRRPSGP
jgi:MFS family permease